MAKLGKVCGRINALIAAIFAAWWSLGLDDLKRGVARPNSDGRVTLAAKD